MEVPEVIVKEELVYKENLIKRRIPKIVKQEVIYEQ